MKKKNTIKISKKTKSQILIYQTEKRQTQIEVHLEEENVWFTQKGMAELYQTTKQIVYKLYGLTPPRNKNCCA